MRSAPGWGGVMVWGDGGRRNTICADFFLKSYFSIEVFSKQKVYIIKSNSPMLGCQFQGFSGKSARWGGGAGTVGEQAGWARACFPSCLSRPTHPRARLASRFVPHIPMPPEAQTAQGSQPFHPDLNSGLRTPPSFHLTFFAKMSPAK